MYNLNINTNIQVHNSYCYQLIDKNNNVIEENTVYNNSSSGVFVGSVGTNRTNSAHLTVKYLPTGAQDEGSEHYNSTGTTINFARVTRADSINFGSTIEFTGSADFSYSSFTGTIKGFKLGGPIYVKHDDDTEVELYWSEAGASGTKSETTKLHVTIKIYFSVSAPNLGSSSRYYSRDLSSLLNINGNYFPTPGVDFIALSALDISKITSPMQKKIPILTTLPTIGKGDPEQGTYKTYNPTTSKEREGYVLLSTGEYNYGIAKTVVYGNVGAAKITGGGMSGSSYIPAARLNAQAIKLLLEQDKPMYYFFCSVPEGCEYTGLEVNGGESNVGLTWKNPDDESLKRISITGVGIEDDDNVTSISSYTSSSGEGKYYANYLFGQPGDYWIPPDGSSTICPRYIYLGEKPNNIFAGANISATVQGKIDNVWKTIASTRTYQTIYIPDEVEAAAYRLIVSAPETKSTGYYVNAAEKLVIPEKSYDHNILCIGNKNNDFGTAGIGISRETLQERYNSLLNDNSNSIILNIGIRVSCQQGFYKNTNVMTYMSYGVEASG